MKPLQTILMYPFRGKIEPIIEATPTEISLFPRHIEYKNSYKYLRSWKDEEKEMIRKEEDFVDNEGSIKLCYINSVEMDYVKHHSDIENEDLVPCVIISHTGGQLILRGRTRTEVKKNYYIIHNHVFKTIKK